MFLAYDRAYVSRTRWSGLFLLLFVLTPHDSNVAVYASVDCVACSICHCSDRSVYHFSKDLFVFPEEKILKLPRTRPIFLILFVVLYSFPMASSMSHTSKSQDGILHVKVISMRKIYFQYTSKKETVRLVGKWYMYVSPSNNQIVIREPENVLIQYEDVRSIYKCLQYEW